MHLGPSLTYFGWFLSHFGQVLSNIGQNSRNLWWSVNQRLCFRRNMDPSIDKHDRNFIENIDQSGLDISSTFFPFSKTKNCHFGQIWLTLDHLCVWFRTNFEWFWTSSRSYWTVLSHLLPPLSFYTYFKSFVTSSKSFWTIFILFWRFFC